jgi:hypothetical protein
MVSVKDKVGDGDRFIGDEIVRAESENALSDFDDVLFLLLA